MTHVQTIDDLVFWRSPRTPIEPLLAEVMATVSELEQHGTRLTLGQACYDLVDFTEELEDMRRHLAMEDLRTQFLTIAIAAIRAIRDVCGDK